MDSLRLLFEAPLLNLQLLVDGVLVGAVFALVAYGMALQWGVMNLINVAQGDFVMLGGYSALLAVNRGVPPLLAVPCGAVVVAAISWILYRVVVQRVVRRELFASILATYGIGIVLQQLANQLFGSDVRTIESGLGSVSIAGGMLSFARIKVVAFVGAIALGAVLIWFLGHSRLGRAIRATAQNARAARVLGVDPDRVYAATFAINGAVCGAAGGLVAMTWLVQPYAGLGYTVRSFMVVVAAGVGNVAGIAAASCSLSVVENYAGFVLGTQYQSAFVFSLLVVVLVARNRWLMRQRTYLK